MLMSAWDLEIHNRVAILTFNRPPNNWMNLASMTELAERLEALGTNTDEATVIMLTGGVNGYFIAHADLDDLTLFAKGQKPEGDPAAVFAARTAVTDGLHMALDDGLSLEADLSRKINASAAAQSRNPAVPRP